MLIRWFGCLFRWSRCLGALQVGNEASGWAGDHGHQLPSIFAPVVEDLFCGVLDERTGGVFPFSHGTEYATWLSDLGGSARTGS